MSAASDRRFVRTGVIAVAVAVSSLVAGWGPGATAAATGSRAPTTPTQGAPATDADASAPSDTPTTTGPSLELIAQSPAVDPAGTFEVVLGARGVPDGSYVVADVYPRAEVAEDLTLSTDGPDVSFDPVPLGPAGEDGGRLGRVALSLYRSGDDRPDGPFAYRLDEPGVYPVRIRLQDQAGELLATMATAIVVVPGSDDPAVEPVTLALVVSLGAPTPTDPAVRADPGGVTDAMTDLATDLEDLLAVIDARPGVPVAFAPTPDTVSRLALAPTTEAAVQHLREALAEPGRDVVGAPFVDVDPSALVAEGLGGELGRQRDAGSTTLATVLEEPMPATWATGRPLDADGLGALTGLGVDRILLTGAAAGAAVDRGPFPLATADGAVPTLATAGVHDLSEGGDGVLRAHQILARLALPSEASGATVLPVEPGATDLDGLATLLDVLSFGTGYVRAGSLTDAYGVEAVAAPPLGTPRPAADPRYRTEAAKALADLGSYASMIGERTDLLERFERPLLFASAADLGYDQRRAEIASVQRSLDESFAAVALPRSDKITLGARHASFPVPVTSELEGPVQVLVEVRSTDRIDVPEPSLQTVDGSGTIEIDVTTKAAGDTPVDITLRTPDGRVLLAEARYTVRSTALSGMGLILTVGAGAFLALWWGRHLIRSRRARRSL